VPLIFRLSTLQAGDYKKSKVYCILKMGTAAPTVLNAKEVMPDIYHIRRWVGQTACHCTVLNLVFSSLQPVALLLSTLLELIRYYKYFSLED